MTYSISQKFNMNIDDFIKLCFDKEHIFYLDKNLSIKKRVTLQEHKDKKIVLRRYKVFPERKIPKFLRPLISRKEIAYIEERVFYKDQNTLTFFITSCILPRKIRCSGSCFIQSLNSTCILREAKGELIVKIPVIGKLAEKFIIKDLVKSFEKSADLTNQYMKKKLVVENSKESFIRR